MNSESEPVDLKKELDASITDEQIDALCAEKTRNGATNCRVVTENGKRFLVWTLPALE